MVPNFERSSRHERCQESRRNENVRVDESPALLLVRRRVSGRGQGGGGGGQGEGRKRERRGTIISLHGRCSFCCSIRVLPTSCIRLTREITHRRNNSGSCYPLWPFCATLCSLNVSPFPPLPPPLYSFPAIKPAGVRSELCSKTLRG